MKLIVNGQEIDSGVEKLDQLIREYQLKEEHVVAEVNGVIIDRSSWSQHELNQGDIIELVHFVGGG
ncbi:sulfur carrier protein ThiS [Caldalkalibacillus mannanilyticus]|uniref:sulfur carrier protein ThiS n=1 Tax=Caldalkalibacillus mannanilyticus TaxID=1418 RepID=UPI00046B032F|nr:sulfur carrier protein ThiS [Caldalkalibacillus mannanilyticus]